MQNYAVICYQLAKIPVADRFTVAFPFPDLEEGALVVDVGGGIGSTTLRLAQRFPKLRFVIQDREPVCKLGEDVRHFFWNHFLQY